MDSGTTKSINTKPLHVDDTNRELLCLGLEAIERSVKSHPHNKELFYRINRLKVLLDGK